MYFNKAASVYRAIEDIAATSSKKEKEAILKAAGTAAPLFMKVVTYAYDPFRVYGIGKEVVPKKTPGIAPGANTLEEPWAWNCLDCLAQGTLSGDAARTEVQKWVDMLDEPSSELFRRILMGDMRAGFTDGTINRVFPGTIAEFPYMRCTLPKKSNMPLWDWLVGIIVQEKADAMFTNTNVRDDGYVTVTTRAGTPIPLDNLPDLLAAIRRNLRLGTQTHGELCVYQDGQLMNREDGNGVLNHVASGGALAENQTVLLQVWDQIPLSSVKPKGKDTTPYKQRLASLIRQVSAGGAGAVKVIPTKMCRTKGEAWDYYRDLLRRGREGVVCKHPDSIWQDTSTGNKDVVKLKLEVDVDLEVEEILPGDVGSKNEGRPGRIKMRSSDGQLVVNVAVKNEKMRDELEKDPNSWLSKIMPVRANSIMLPGDSNPLHSLFLPRFAEAKPRIDKSVADSLEQVQDQFKNAVEAA